MKCGALPSGYSSRDLSGKLLLKAVAPPTIPDKCDWSSKMTKPIGMMGNSQYGSCTHTSISHLVNCYRGQHGLKQDITEAEIVAGYLEMSPQDQGLPLRPVLERFRGKKDKSIGKHRCAGYARLDHTNIESLRAAIYLFGGAYVAFTGPSNITDMASWATPSPEWRKNPNNGHCIALLGYGPKEFIAASWNALPPMAYGYFLRYGVEAWSVVSAEWWNGKAKAPSGLILTDTMQALQRIAA